VLLGVDDGEGVGVAVGPDGVGVAEPGSAPMRRGSNVVSMGSPGLKALATEFQGTYL